MFAALVIGLALALGACGDNHALPVDAGPVNPPTCRATRGSNILLRQVVTLQGEVPLLVTAPPGDDRQFIVEQYGRIAILDGDQLQPAPFLDISADTDGPVVIGSERGLLGLAFPPNYADSGELYVYYTTLTSDVIARYRRIDDDHADPASGEILLEIDHPLFNHNGGMIEFGSDGLLYIGTGDGGGAGDQDHHAGDPFSLLGKLLRIDVSTPPLDNRPYVIPVDNPFADGTTGAPEVFSIGLRNPWRWSFDRGSDDLWIGDVGQDLYEELDVISLSQARGADFGWSTFEGDSCFRPPCDATGKIAPVSVHTHAEGWCSVIGGAVYRGSCYPDLVGEHLFTDYCAHTIETARRTGAGVQLRSPKTKILDLGSSEPYEGSPVTPASLHADSRGELYLTTVSCCGSSFIGAVYHVEATP